MSVVLGLSALLKVRRSSSVYRSFSALAALIQFSCLKAYALASTDVYRSFATDGCIFHLETLARSLGNTCAEKEYLHALVDLGRAAVIAAAVRMQRYDDTAMRTELCDAIHLQQYVPSPPTQSYLILFLSRAHNDVSLASVSKASIVFAKAYASLRLPPHSLRSCCTVETVYFALIFLIHSLNMLYLEGDNTLCQKLALRQLFLSRLYHWFRATSDRLPFTLSRGSEGLSRVYAVELLRSPFDLYVSPHMPTLLSVEINRHPQVL